MSKSGTTGTVPAVDVGGGPTLTGAAMPSVYAPAVQGADTRQWSWEQTVQLAGPMITLALEERKRKEAEKDAEEANAQAERRAAMGMVGRIGAIAPSPRVGGDLSGFSRRGSFGRG